MTRAIAMAIVISSLAARADEPEPPALAGVEVTEKLGARLPLDLAFTDQAGRRVALRDLLGGRPMVLDLAYFECPMLCPLVTNGLTASLRELPFRLGDDYQVITVSINPRDTPVRAAAKRLDYLRVLGLGEAAMRDDRRWPFLTGDERSIRALADAVGYGYRFDPRTGQFAHGAALALVAPDGRVVRYLYGVQFPPREMKLALVEAGQGRVGTSLDRALLRCYRWDPASRRYGLFVHGFLRVGGGAVFLLLAGLLTHLWRRERRRISSP